MKILFPLIHKNLNCLMPADELFQQQFCFRSLKRYLYSNASAVLYLNILLYFTPFKMKYEKKNCSFSLFPYSTGTGKLQKKSSLRLVFVNEAWLTHSHALCPHCLWLLCLTTAEPNACDFGHTAHKTQNICHLALQRKSASSCVNTLPPLQARFY